MIYHHINKYTALTPMGLWYPWLLSNIIIYLLKDSPLPETYLSRSKP